VLVVVALSGGVDSAVAAALLRREGHEVVGVTMQIWPEDAPGRAERRGGCCGLGAVRDARAVAEALGIPYYVFHMREVFEREVIRRFVAAYAEGRTPNPCIACNAHIKFAALAEKARRLGADALATGHYARIGTDAHGQPTLLRARDRRKDQSYVLYPLRREELGFFRFPIGELPDKATTRRLAAAFGLPVAAKPDSQELCFVGEEGHAAFVGARRPEAVRPGPILDLDGRVLGTHRGLAHYTVGQRRGLGLPGPEPLFVVALDPERNAVVVAPARDAVVAGCRVREANWLADPPEDGARATAQVGAGATERPVAVWRTEDGFRVAFLEPVRGVAPGQALVLYDGDRVLGGGEIAEVALADQAVAAPAVSASR
jgi:tRNA-specific 2-thiouridylase